MKHPSEIESFIRCIAAGVAMHQLEIEFQGLDLNVVDMHGRTPLMVAAGAGVLEVVEMLVRNGASVHAIGRGLSTPVRF